MAYEVIDDFLPKDQHEMIAEAMLSGDFPWFYNNAIVSENDGEVDTVNNYQFTHNFYSHYSWNSNFSDLVMPLVEKISPRSLVRIKANLSPVTHEPIDGRWHTDYGFECTTAVYYVNSNNGYTKFRSGHVVESVANRIVIFDSHDLHTGGTATDTKVRCLINLNYL